MLAVNWGDFDLTLLVVFDAVMRDSVSGMGSRIGSGKPALQLQMQVRS